MTATSQPEADRSSTGWRDWLRLLGATAVFLLVSAFARFLPSSSRWLLPVVIFSLVPVGIVVVATLAAMLAYPLLETIGLPARRPQMVCAVLVGSFRVGIAIFSRRYE